MEVDGRWLSFSIGWFLGSHIFWLQNHHTCCNIVGPDILVKYKRPRHHRPSHYNKKHVLSVPRAPGSTGKNMEDGKKSQRGNKKVKQFATFSAEISRNFQYHIALAFLTAKQASLQHPIPTFWYSNLVVLKFEYMGTFGYYCNLKSWCHFPPNRNHQSIEADWLAWKRCW